jgi:Transposase DDE domain group 1
LRVQRDERHLTVEVSADGEGLVSHAGAALVAEAADRLGLTRALSSGLAGMRRRRGGHDPGRVVRDLAVMLADGGDCLSDLRAVRDQQPLFGPVASTATAFRVIDQIARDPALLAAVREARACARARAWAAGAAPEQIIIDIDATLITSHSDKDGAAGTFKGGFGFHPLLAYLDDTREALAAVLRPGNAGANTASDHVRVLDLALEQLGQVETTGAIVVRTDSAGATHQFTDELRAARINFVMGYDLTEAVRETILTLPEAAWAPAIGQDGENRDGAWVAEITDRLELGTWPDGTRVIVRRERPHPGAQLSFTDHDGHRYLATLTDLDGDAVELERLHRARASAEDRIRAAKQTGLENLPFREFDHNAIWLELSLIAQDLTAWTQHLALDGELARCEPKTLRYRLLHTAARLALHARRATLRLPRTWPWARQLAAAFARLAALPPPAR